MEIDCNNEHENREDTFYAKDSIFSAQTLTNESNF